MTAAYSRPGRIARRSVRHSRLGFSESRASRSGDAFDGAKDRNGSGARLFDAVVGFGGFRQLERRNPVLRRIRFGARRIGLRSYLLRRPLLRSLLRFVREFRGAIVGTVVGWLWPPARRFHRDESLPRAPLRIGVVSLRVFIPLIDHDLGRRTSPFGSVGATKLDRPPRRLGRRGAQEIRQREHQKQDRGQGAQERQQSWAEQRPAPFGSRLLEPIDIPCILILRSLSRHDRPH